MMAGTLRVRRSRGALTGVLLVLLGIWGALIPFVGPYFHYAYTPDQAWTATAGRTWLEVLPGVVTIAGGLVVLSSRFRPAGLLGAWLAALALVAGHWTGIPTAGSPVGGATRAALEQIGFFTGLGIVIVFLAALALGRYSVVAAKDAAVATATAQTAEADAAAAEAEAARAEKTAAASDRTSRRPAVIKPVPVFRARQRAAASSAKADEATAKADEASAKASEAAATAGQPS
jgi:hypothetical protein